MVPDDEDSYNRTLDEMRILVEQMSDGWQAGLALLAPLKAKYGDDPNRRIDLTTAEALGIHFRTGYNILRFYDLRENLLYEPGEKPTALLDEIRTILEEEIESARAGSG